MALDIGVNAFIDITDADAYFEDNIQFEAWNGLTFDQKSRALITAGGQINLVLIESCQFVIDEIDINVNVANANAELGLAFAVKPSSAGQSSTGSNIKKVGAGSAAVEFFSPTKGTRFPTQVTILLKASECLASGASFFGAVFDNDGESIFSEPDYQRSRGFS